MSSTLVIRLKAMLANHPRNGTPVPSGCVPDADHVRDLDSAIEAPTTAYLDRALALPRPTIERPGADDYDAWQAWAIDLLG
jgi:hypothetical protein